MEKNRYYINPDASILTNMTNFIGQFAIRSIGERFKPFDAAQEMFEKGQFNLDSMLAFEDVTWDTVFARMKTVEFSNALSEEKEGVKPQDMVFYMDYTDMIHDIKSDELIDQFGLASVEVSEMICLELLKYLKAQILPVIEQRRSTKEIIAELKAKVAPAIIDSIKKYYTESDDGIEDELKKLFDETEKVFEKLEYDETTFFRVIFASLVKGTEVLICNPEYLQLGDRIKSATKYYLAGASISVGKLLSMRLKPEEYNKLQKVAPGVVEYLPTLISMAVACAFVVSIDKNPLMVALTEEFKKIPTITGNIALYRENALAFEQMAAKLAELNLEELQRSIEGFDHLVVNMETAGDPKQLNDILLAYYKDNNKELPWGNRSIEEHWADKNSRLVFK